MTVKEKRGLLWWIWIADVVIESLMSPAAIHINLLVVLILVIVDFCWVRCEDCRRHPGIGEVRQSVCLQCGARFD